MQYQKKAESIYRQALIERDANAKLIAPAPVDPDRPTKKETDAIIAFNTARVAAVAKLSKAVEILNAANAAKKAGLTKDQIAVLSVL